MKVHYGRAGKEPEQTDGDTWENLNQDAKVKRKNENYLKKKKSHTGNIINMSIIVCSAENTGTPL